MSPGGQSLGPGSAAASVSQEIGKIAPTSGVLPLCSYFALNLKDDQERKRSSHRVSESAPGMSEA